MIIFFFKKKKKKTNFEMTKLKEKTKKKLSDIVKTKVCSDDIQFFKTIT